ncbi:MAG: class I SAM-dependent methyltransferase [Desulfobulbaceae bacterium]|nr:class I SAM-dependent methyltransferase [Desulfobulbaceae bacterium]
MNCPVCKQGSMQPTKELCKDYISEKFFKLLRCNKCSCAKTDFKEEDFQNDFYGPVYYNSSKGKFIPLIEKIFQWNHKRNAKNIYHNFKPKNVLEVGCGRAYLLKELANLGIEVSCLESATAADWILNNKDVTVATLSDSDEKEWPFPVQCFDLIVYWHVFEHIDDPILSLEQATKTLKNGKTLCISVPNISSIQARIKPTAWFHLDVPRHLYHFSKNGLVELLTKQGYRIEKVVAGDAIQNLYGWFQTLANLFTPNHPNTLYRFLQGGDPLRTVSKLSLVIQLVTSVIWVPAGILGYLVESITGMHGNITIYAVKTRI